MTSVCLTALKKVEDELRESECRYRAVVEQAAEGIVLFDVDSKRALEANVACQNLLGYTPEAILRLTSYQFSEVLIASPKPPWLHLSGVKRPWRLYRDSFAFCLFGLSMRNQRG